MYWMLVVVMAGVGGSTGSAGRQGRRDGRQDGGRLGLGGVEGQGQ